MRMVKQAEKRRKRSPLLPVFGLVLALGFAAIAYVLSVPAYDFLMRQRVNFGTLGVNTAQLLIAAAIWIVLFGSSMFLVAILAGRTYDEDLSLKYYKEETKRRKQKELEKRRPRR